MSFIRRALEGRASSSFSFHPSSPALAQLFGITENPAGIDVRHGESLTLSGVWAAVNLLSRSVAAIPLNVYRRLPNGGREIAHEHPLQRVLHLKPNEDQTSSEWRQMMQGHLCLRGNAFGEIVTLGNGTVSEIYPWHPDRVRLVREQSQLTYYYRGEAGTERPVPASRVVHLRGLALSGIIGLDPISAARRSLGIAVAAEEYAARIFKNSARPDGVLKHPSTLSEEASKRLSVGWNARHGGAENAGKTAVLEEGMEWQAIGLSPENSQMLATRKFSTTQIAQWFGLPPHMIGDLERATFTNIEQQAIDYVTHSLMPWLTAWEQRLTVSLLMPSEQGQFFIAFVVEGLLRGDSKARADFYRALFAMGAITPNQIRAYENMNPVEGGNEVMLPLNMIPASKAEEFYTKLIENPGAASQQGGNQESRALGLDGDDLPVPRAKRVTSIEWRAVDRVAKSFEPTLVSAIEKVIRGEKRTALRQAEKLISRAGAESFSDWLTTYYAEGGEFRTFASDTLEPALRALVASIDDRAASEVGADALDPDILSESARSYSDAFATNHAVKSERMMLRTVQETQEAGADVIAAITAAFALWLTERPSREAARESIRASRGSQRQAYERGGRRARWVAVGKTCPYCLSLDGKIVGAGAHFASSGDVLEGDGTPMKVSHNVFAPPVHGGCDCQLAPA